MERGRSKSFSRPLKRTQKPKANPARRSGVKPKPARSGSKSPSKARQPAHERTPQAMCKHQEYYSPDLHEQSDDKGLIAKTLHSNRKFRHQNADYQKFLEVGKSFLLEGVFSSAVDCLLKAVALEPEDNEAKYLLSMTYLADNKTQLAEECLLELIRQPGPRKHVFLLLAVCLKKQGRPEQVDDILSQCLRRFPKYYEAHAYRAKIRLRARRLEEALRDFETAIALVPGDPTAHIGKADVLRALGRQAEALAILAKMGGKSPSDFLLLKQALCQLQLGKFDEALALAEQALKRGEGNSEAYFVKGLILQRGRKEGEAVLQYERAIRQYSSVKAVAKSFYQLMKIQIEQKDYYSAVYTAIRVKRYGLEQRTLSKFAKFLEGTLALRKKECPEALVLFEEFEREHRPGDFLRPLLLNFRSCCLIYQGDYQGALHCLTQLEQQYSLDLQSAYNKCVCEGVLAAGGLKYEQALTNFTKAKKYAPTRHEPLLYKAMTLVRFCCKNILVSDSAKRDKYIAAALKNIDRGLRLSPRHHALLYHRALLLLRQGKLAEAAVAAEAALAAQSALKETGAVDVHIVRILYVQGLIRASQKDICRAVEDLSGVIEMDRRKEIPEAFLSRAKCLLFYGDKEAALSDLQTYMVSNPSDPAIHLWIGYILFHFKSFEESIKAYSNIANLRSNPLVLRLRADAYLATKQIKSCADDLRLLAALQPDPLVLFDTCFLEAVKVSLVSDKPHFEQAFDLLQRAREASPSGHYFDAKSLMFYEGVFLFFLGEYHQAYESIKEARASKSKKKSDSSEGLSTSEMDYNLALCCIMLGSLGEAVQLLEEAGKGLSRGEEQQVRFLREAVTSTRDKKTMVSVGEEEECELQLFSRPNKLSNAYPQILLPLSARIIAKFSFCLPVPEPFAIPPEFDPARLLELMTPSAVEPVPQLPWINKGSDNETLVFTEYMKYGEEEIQISEDWASGADDEEGGASAGSLVAEREVPERSELREFLRLDEDTNARLDRLLKRQNDRS